MDPDISMFATDLYSFIWWKFKFSFGAEMIGERMREVIGIAVACQQLLVRNYVKEKFTLRHSYIMEHPGFISEMATNMAQGRLDYFTYLFRCSAFIAEYFIYRKNCLEATNLAEAPLVWIKMFKTTFIRYFEINGGWEAMTSTAQRITAEYYPIFQKYERELFVPESRLVPRTLCTAFDKIKLEIILGYAGYDLYDEWKEFRPKSFPCPCKYINARARSQGTSVDTKEPDSGSPQRKKSKTVRFKDDLESGPSSQSSPRGSKSGLGVDPSQPKVYRVNINRPWERIAYGPYGPLEPSASFDAPGSSKEPQKGAEAEPAVHVSPEVQSGSASGITTEEPSKDIPMEEDP